MSSVTEESVACAFLVSDSLCRRSLWCSAGLTGRLPRSFLQASLRWQLCGQSGELVPGSWDREREMKCGSEVGHCKLAAKFLGNQSLTVKSSASRAVIDTGTSWVQGLTHLEARRISGAFDMWYFIGSKVDFFCSFHIFEMGMLLMV